MLYIYGTTLAKPKLSTWFLFAQLDLPSDVFNQVLHQYPNQAIEIQIIKPGSGLGTGNTVSYLHLPVVKVASSHPAIDYIKSVAKLLGQKAYIIENCEILICHSEEDLDSTIYPRFHHINKTVNYDIPDYWSTKPNGST